MDVAAVQTRALKGEIPLSLDKSHKKRHWNAEFCPQSGGFSQKTERFMPFFSFYLLLSTRRSSYCFSTKSFAPRREPNTIPRMHRMRLPKTNRVTRPATARWSQPNPLEPLWETLMQKHKGPFQISGMGEPRPVEGSAGLRSTVPHGNFLEDPELNYPPGNFPYQRNQNSPVDTHLRIGIHLDFKERCEGND
jgi:hypothetical protein